MILEVKVPTVGESITEGVLTTWLKPDGSVVKEGDEIFELETDKITMAVQAEKGGKLTIKVEPNSAVEIGQVVATLDTDAQADSAPVVKHEQKTVLQTEGPDLTPPAGVQQMEHKLAQPHNLDDLSPAVRRMVEEFKLDPRLIPATGKDGRITKEDVIKFMETVEEATKATITLPPHPKPEPLPFQPQPKREPVMQPIRATAPRDPSERQTRQPMSSLRARAAERLVLAQQTAAILTTFNEVDMSNVMAMRKKFKDIFKEKHEVGLGFMSFFVKAVVDALKTYPKVSAQIDGSDIVYNHFYDIGIAVSTDKGLVVPNVRDADKLSFAEVELAIINLAGKARDRKLTLDDLQGGVFTVSNGGTFGSLLSTPILNTPQSAILGMHAIKERPVVVDGQIVIRPMMYLAMSYDHRLIDGSESVTFLKRIVECVENPERMLLRV